MNTVASIEIGTNSIRMLIAEKGLSGRTIRPVLRKRVITRLGEDFTRETSGTIKPGPTARTFKAAQDFFLIASQFGVFRPTVVATGVVRTALNKDAFISFFAEKFDHHVKVISGHEEANLTCRGVLSSLDHRGKPLVIFDIGGGSTEFIWSTRDKGHAVSIELGGVVLTENFLATDPPSDKELSQLISHIDDIFEAKLTSFKQRWEGEFSIVGTGGAVVTLAAMIHDIGESGVAEEKINGLTVHKNDVRFLFDKMKVMPAQERLDLKGLESGREDIILAGTTMVLRIMDYFGKDEIVISYSDLLEGILIPAKKGEKNG